MRLTTPLPLLLLTTALRLHAVRGQNGAPPSTTRRPGAPPLRTILTTGAHGGTPTGGGPLSTSPPRTVLTTPAAGGTTPSPPTDVTTRPTALGTTATTQGPTPPETTTTHRPLFSTLTALSTISPPSLTCAPEQWVVTPNLQAPGAGVFKPDIRSEQSCQASCLNDFNCVGYEFAPSAALCWVLNTSFVAGESFPGINHYRLQRQCTIGTNSCTFTYEGLYQLQMPSATPPVTDLDLCLLTCLGDPQACVGVAYGVVTAACQVANTPQVLQSRTRHFDFRQYRLSCQEPTPATVSTTTTAVTTTTTPTASTMSTTLTTRTSPAATTTTTITTTTTTTTTTTPPSTTTTPPRTTTTPPRTTTTPPRTPP